MQITRKSPFTGAINTMEIEVTPDQIRRWEGGEVIQAVFPHLSADEREFIKSGITPQEWLSMMGGDE